MTVEVISELVVYVNDTVIRESNPDPLESLISFLRRHRFTGTKLGCSEGGCGSCTVLVTQFDYSLKKLDSLSINACLAPAVSLHQKHVLTIEGLGSQGNLHPTQKAVANSNGSQCGFCTPGIVMSLFTEMTTNPNPTAHSIEEAFDGNLCRCTGYRPILEGAKALVCTSDCNNCPSTEECKEIEDLIVPIQERKHYHKVPSTLVEYHQSLAVPRSYMFEKYGVKWFHPSSRQQLVDLLDQYPHAKIINGNTEVGIEVRFKNQNYPVFINTGDVAELKYQTITGKRARSILTVSFRFRHRMGCFDNRFDLSSTACRPVKEKDRA
jgi:xanthine dehydrogenase/oxidase